VTAPHPIPLGTAVVEDGDTLRSRIAEAVRQDAVACGTSSHPSDAEDIEYLLTLLVRCAVGDMTATSAVSDRRLAAIGTAWTSRRNALAVAARAYQVALRVIIDYMREVGARTGRRPIELLGTIERVLEACNSVAVAVAGEYHAARCREQRTGFLRALLLGLLGASELARQAPAHGLDPDGVYLAFRARPCAPATADDLTPFGMTPWRPHPKGLCAVVGLDLFGVVIAPRQDFPGVAGLGPPCRLDRLADSFRMATRALDTAMRCGLTGAHAVSQLGLLPAVSSDIAVGEALYRRYLAPLGDTASGAEIAKTVHVYLLEHMNVARTAVRLFVHPNTVRYRINRFEELTGRHLRGSSTMVFEMLWALEHRNQTIRVSPSR
jgi:predicted metal-dependent hydrolase